MPKKFIIVISANREQLGTGLSCFRFSVFCEKFFVRSVFSVVLGSQFFAKKKSSFVKATLNVVLNWNETTYGTKAYTIEINGASHSSHNIQLNEAVVFSDIEVLVSPQGNGDTATNITTNLSSGYTPNPPHDSAIRQRLSNNNTNTHDLANAVAWRNSDNNTDTKIIYEFPFITNVSKWEIWDARRD